MRFVAGILLCVSTLPTAAAPTFHGEVAPIIYTQCLTCHRAGQIGPFALASYADVKKRVKQIVRVTESRTMPPWKPQPGWGEFHEARRLTDAQLATLKAWADAGAPEGDPATAPLKPQFPDGWQLGQPDVIVKMQRPFAVPSEGNDIYMHFVFPLNLTKERHIRAIEVLPGNRRVAHHAIGLLDISGTARKLGGKSGSYPGLGSPGFIPAGFTPGYVPGQTPRFFPQDTAITVKPGTDFVLQMHYHPVGKPEVDQTELGIYFTDKKPQRGICGLLLGSEDIDIPAGAKEYKRTDKLVLPAPLEVRDIWAHMHMVGKEVKVWAECPDGKTKKMLWINDWDFNWQDSYRYAEPFTLPKGTVIHAEFTYDNTSANPRNPNRPPKRVTHGEKSTDEMAGIWIGGVAPQWTDELALWGAAIGHFFELAEQAKQAKKKK